MIYLVSLDVYCEAGRLTMLMEGIFDNSKLDEGIFDILRLYRGIFDIIPL